MHNHHEHAHTFKYCPRCDVVYCEGCGREWGVKIPYTISPYTITLPAGGPIYCGGGPSDSITGTAASHTHTDVTSEG